MARILARQPVLPSWIDLRLQEAKVGTRMKPSTSSGVWRKGLGGMAAVVGFLLSPLSWWNDLVVNVPLALTMAWAISYFYPPAFTSSFVGAYWLTNVIGLLLMHWGIGTAAFKSAKPYTRKQLVRDLAIACFYTAIILLLVKLKLIGPIPQDLLH